MVCMDMSILLITRFLIWYVDEPPGILLDNLWLRPCLDWLIWAYLLTYVPVRRFENAHKNLWDTNTYDWRRVQCLTRINGRTDTILTLVVIFNSFIFFIFLPASMCLSCPSVHVCQCFLDGNNFHKLFLPYFHKLFGLAYD